MTAKADDETILELLPGRTCKQVAEIVGCSDRTVWRVKTEHNLTTGHHNKPWTPELHEQVKAMVDDGVPLKEITRTLHVHSTTVRKKFNYYGMTKSEAGKIGARIRFSGI